MASYRLTWGTGPTAESGSGEYEELSAPEAPEARRVPRPRPAAMIGLAAMAAVGASGATAYASEAAGAAGVGRVGVSARDTASTPQADTTDPGLALAARLSSHADAVAKGAQAARVEAAETARAKADARAATTEVGELVAPLAQGELVGSGHAVGLGLGHRGRHGGSYWAQLRTGKDIPARPGALVRAIGDGEITSAGWAGAHGYRVVQTLRDGTEIWYCHLAAVGRCGSVAAGQALGRVGATGGVRDARLHLEVRTGAGEPVDPAAWLSARGLSV